MSLSVSVRFNNNLKNTDLIPIFWNLGHGEWVDHYPQPGATIEAGGFGQWASKSDGLWTGTAGWVRFAPVRHGADGPTELPIDSTVYVSWDAPYVGNNSYTCSAPAPFEIRFDDAAGYQGDSEIIYNFSGLSGVNTCVAGYVWRDAFRGDSVCVLPAARQRAADQNAAAAEHREGQGPACKPGFVWREASGPGKGDEICVSPADRELASQQNAEASSHTL